MRGGLILAIMATACMLYGCGYDDGKAVDTSIRSKPLQPMPARCTSTADCKTDGQILGVCEEKVCRRACDTIGDCEDRAVCDAGVCRPAVKCPSLSFGHLSPEMQAAATAKYQDALCIKVFSHTPSIHFTEALNKDAEINNNTLNAPLFTGDFTSKNYTFTIPRRALDQGLSFGMNTYATMRFVNLLAYASNGLAECLRPEVLDETTHAYNGIGGEKGYEYLSPYHYNFTDESLSYAGVGMLCNNGTDLMEYDMMAYAYYLYYLVEKKNPGDALKELKKPSDSIGDKKEHIKNLYDGAIKNLSEEGKLEGFIQGVYSEYIKMVKMKRSCLSVSDNIDHLIVMADLTATLTGDQEKRLSTLAKAIKIFVSNPDKFKQAAGSVSEELKEMMKYLTEQNPNPGFSQEWRLKVLASNDSAETIGLKMMNSQKRLCIDTLSAVQGSTAFKRFIASPDMKLDACIMSPRVVPGLINMNKLVSQEKADMILDSGDINAIYGSLLDPRWMWLSNANLMSIDVKMGAGMELKPDGIILDATYMVPQVLFEERLVGDTYIQAFPTELTEFVSYKKNKDKTAFEKDGDEKRKKNSIIDRVKDILDLDKSFITTRGDYFRNSPDGSHHAFVYDIKTAEECSELNLPVGAKCPTCNDGQMCTFDLSIVSKKMEDSLAMNRDADTSDPYGCGGLIYNVTKIDGYVVLPKGIEFSGRTVKAAPEQGDHGVPYVHGIQ